MAIEHHAGVSDVSEVQIRLTHKSKRKRRFQIIFERDIKDLDIELRYGWSENDIHIFVDQKEVYSHWKPEAEFAVLSNNRTYMVRMRAERTGLMRPDIKSVAIDVDGHELYSE